MSYNLDPIFDDLCYQGTSILINKFDIRDEQELEKIETVVTFIQSAELEKNPLDGKFDFEHYKAVHKFLFGEIYKWAGEVRSVNISKKGTRFCSHEKIDERAELIFGRLKNLNYFKGLGKDVFVSEIVDFYEITNDLHPFRDGNGRAQRSFLTMLIRFAGYDIDFSEVDVDLLMIATIHASHGVNDLLYEIFTEAIKSPATGIT
jgi:cell filamentation protein